MQCCGPELTTALSSAASTMTTVRSTQQTDGLFHLTVKPWPKHIQVNVLTALRMRKSSRTSDSESRGRTLQRCVIDGQTRSQLLKSGDLTQNPCRGHLSAIEI